MKEVNCPKEKRILLLTQEIGHYDSDGNLEGRESTAKIERSLMEKGCDVRQVKIADCKVSNGQLLENGFIIRSEAYGAVMKRSWDGGYNANHGTEMQRFLESKGLYADNPSAAQDITHDRFKMQSVFEEVGVKTPKTFAIRGEQDANKAIEELGAIYSEKNIDEKYPAFVLKGKQGTHGNGIEFFKTDEKDALKEQLTQASDTNPLVLQEFIPTTLIQGVKEDASKNASHQRIVITRNSKDGEYEYTGGVRFQRNGSWISNASAKEGVPSKEILPEPSKEVMRQISKAASAIGLNQAGVDILDGKDGQGYFSEFNDSMGVTGELLESQGVLDKYTDSFISRSSEHQRSIMEEQSFTRMAS